jgi:hypothetical protein
MQSRKPARFRCRDGCFAVDWLSRFCQSSAKSNTYRFWADDEQIGSNPLEQKQAGRQGKWIIDANSDLLTETW